MYTLGGSTVRILKLGSRPLVVPLIGCEFPKRIGKQVRAGAYIAYISKVND